MTRPPIRYDRAVAILRATGRYDRRRGDHLLADCPRCEQGMRVDGRPGGTARFRCYAECAEDDVAAALLDLAGRGSPRAPARRRDGANEGLPSLPARSPSPSPTPPPSGLFDRKEESDERPELYRLLERYEAGELDPVAVRLGELPPRAGRLMREAAADIALLMGLRLAVDEDRALPYSASLAATRLGLGDDKGWANRVLRSLIEAGVVHVDQHAKCANGAPMRTRCFLPGPRPPVDSLPAGAGRVEADGTVEVDEGEEARQDVAVGEAVADDRREVREGDGRPVAVRDGAGGGRPAGHVPDRTPPRGAGEKT